MHPALVLAGALALAAEPTAPLSTSPASAAGEGAGRGSSFVYGAGYAYFGQQLERGRRSAGGVALTGRFETELAPRTDLAFTLTWGLTDWARAREYLDAGNRAGQWTTDRLAQVERWATRDVTKDEQGARFLGLIFADLFLVLTYAAVPACYVGSAGGATSHLQLDATATFRLGDGPSFAFVEAGAGAATLPHQLVDWRNAFGPAAGIGMQIANTVRIGARGFWSPPGLNSAPFGGTVTTASVTLSNAR